MRERLWVQDSLESQQQQQVTWPLNSHHGRLNDKWEVYNTIHQAVGLPITGQNVLQRPFLLAAPIHSQLKFSRSTVMVPVETGKP